MNPKISKLKAEKEKNLKKIADMNARNEEIDKLITELENLDIIGLVQRSLQNCSKISRRKKHDKKNPFAYHDVNLYRPVLPAVLCHG